MAPLPVTGQASAVLPTTLLEKRAQFHSEDSTGSSRRTLALEIPFIVLAITAVALRVYSRLGIKKKLAVDDVLIIIATICGLARTVISCLNADEAWDFDPVGPTRASELPYYRLIFERRIAYILAATFTRLSVVAYYLRIFPSQLVMLRRLSMLLVCLTLAQFIEILTVLAVACKSISKLWTSDWRHFSTSRCLHSPTYSYSSAIGDTVVNSLIFALPIAYVCRLTKIKIRQKVGLVVMFGLGFTVCIVALLQIPSIRRRQYIPSYFGGTINYLIAIEISLAIVAASLPDLRALIATSFPKFSPLHHRRQATVAENVTELRVPEHEGIEISEPRRAVDTKRRAKKPHRLMESFPDSLTEAGLTPSEEARALSVGH